MKPWVTTGIVFIATLVVLMFADNAVQCHWCGKRVPRNRKFSREYVYRYSGKHHVSRFDYCSHQCMSGHRKFVQATNVQ